MCGAGLLARGFLTGGLFSLEITGHGGYFPETFFLVVNGWGAYWPGLLGGVY